MMTCATCNGPLPAPRRGRPRKFCSERCRKAQYAGTCDTCGGPTDGTTPSRGVATRCAECLEWTPEAILEALHDWGEDHGGIPPKEADAHIGAPGHGRLPYWASVKRWFDNWNAALLAAGYEALRCDRRPETTAAILAAVRAGERTADIADRFGVTENAIHQRLRYRGMTIPRERERGAA
jgi:hypothetical protein